MNDYLVAMRSFGHDLRRLMLSTAIFGFVFFGIYSLLLNLYLLRLGYGPEFIGLANAIGPLALAIVSLPAGQISRKIGSRKPLVLGHFFMSVSLVLLPMGESLPGPWSATWILVMYGLLWFSGAFTVVNSNPFLMGTSTAQNRNYAFSIQTSLLPVAGFAGNLVGGLLPGLFALLLGMTLAEATPYRYALIVAGALEFFAALSMWQTSEISVESVSTEQDLSKSDGAEPSDIQKARQTSKMPIMLISVISLVWLLRVASEWTMRIFFNVYLDTELETSTALIGVLLAAGQLLGLAALFAPFAIQRYGKVRTIVGAMVGMALAFIPLIAIAHWLAVGVSFVAMIALVSLSTPIYGLFSQEAVAPSWRTTIASSMSMALGVGAAMIAFGGGYVILALGYSALFAIGGGLALLGALIFGIYFSVPRGEAMSPAASGSSLSADD